jgi:glycerol-3-phosphate dehydrogenase
VLYAIRNEMACTLADILIRRTGIGTLGHPGEQVIETISQLAARELKWDRARLDRELEAARKLLTVPA